MYVFIDSVFSAPIPTPGWEISFRIGIPENLDIIESSSQQHYE
jgi:hypothetical protein